MKQVSLVILQVVVALFGATFAIVYVLGDDDGDDETARTEQPVASTATGSLRAFTGDSDYLFAQDRLHTFELTIDDTALARIDADPTAEEYVEAALTFEGETISPVGVRYKGSIGAFIGCVEGDPIAGAAGAKTCTKLSMKVKVNWDDPGREFYGQRRLQFHSQNTDPSHLRERVGYHLFAEMGVAAPRSTHARLVINGEYVGLFAMTEQIDGRFVRDRFDDGSGNLYKEAWPFTSDGAVVSDAWLAASLRTNEDDPADFSMMQGFATDVLAASIDEYPGVLSQWTDREALVAYVAVDRTIRHDDGPFHWYCSADGCGTQNFYWYEEPGRGVLHLVPWDLDGAFVNLLAPDPVTNVADDLGEITADCEPFIHGAAGGVQRSATCDPLFFALTSLSTEIDAASAQLVAGPLSAERLDPLLDEWVAQIEPAVAEAAEEHPDAPSVDEWRGAVADLRAALDVARTAP